METKLARIAAISEERPEEKFTSLYHYLNEEFLIECHKELPANKASGIDKMTKNRYGENLGENIQDLVNRLKRKVYRPHPVRRTHILKDEKNTRPLGIPAYEDKIVQLALTKILQAIFEPNFLECSYGFRPRRGCHDALISLNSTIKFGKISYVVDADIRGFFTSVDHRWLLEMISLKIADPNVKRLIVKFLKAGVVEGGIKEATESGTPQGAVLSPVLANVYLHYVLDLWFEKCVKPEFRGEAHIIRYADDFVCCFQYKEEAYRFYNALIKRLDKFALEIAEEKTKVIMFGRFAATDCKRGGKKPDTFDFLGFTHYCSTSRNGEFRVKRKTSRNKFKSKIKKFNLWMKANRHDDMEGLMGKIRRSLVGYYRYYGITDNIKSLKLFQYKVKRIIFKWLNRRSQKRSFNWDKFELMLKRIPLPTPKIYVNIYGAQT